MKRKDNEKLFTLIELMVVVSIIVILISVLMPAINKAKGTAQKIQCVNKMKQIGVQIFMYCDDFNGVLPAEGSEYRTPISALGVHWPNYINYYYFNDVKYHTLTNPSIHFLCPSDKSPYWYQGIVNSYGFNAYIMSGRSERPVIRLADLVNASQTYMITDSNWPQRWAFGYSGPLYIRLEHNKTTNMFYGDGHISSINEQAPAPAIDIPWFKK